MRAADLRPRVCAHRGGAGSAPENTLAACRRALEVGVEW
ncbi:MAG: glycerophosphodiester phosphodiesterase, partial [candidate division GAL15 bacterium]